MSDVDDTIDRIDGALTRRRHLEGRVVNGIVDCDDPAQWMWPPTLALEIAMQIEPTRNTCESYGIDRDKWNAIRTNPVFISEVVAAREALRQEGASFKARAGMQALELLKETWRLIHDPVTPHNVKADLIKFVIKVAGLDASRDQGILGRGAGAGGGFAININLGGSQTVVDVG